MALWLRPSLLNATIGPLSLWGTTTPGHNEKMQKKIYKSTKKSAKMRARTNMLPEKETRIFFVFFKNDLSSSNLCHFRTAEATAARLVANESSFDVDSETPIVDLTITSESPFITVKRCTKTYGLGSI